MPQGWALTRQAQWAAGMAKLREGSEAALASRVGAVAPVLPRAARRSRWGDGPARGRATPAGRGAGCHGPHGRALLRGRTLPAHGGVAPGSIAHGPGRSRGPYAPCPRRRPPARRRNAGTARHREPDRLWQQQGKRDELEVAGNIYGWFTEGFDTADLQEAKVLLADLEGSLTVMCDVNGPLS